MLAALSITVLLAAAVSAQPASDGHASVKAIASVSEVAAGESFDIALDFKVDKSWHLYGKDPGDSGEPPSIVWTTASSTAASELRFPPTVIHKSAAGVDNVYFDRVALLQTITVPANAAIGSTLKLDGTVSWLVCDARTCLPGEQAVSVTIKVTEKTVPIDTQQFEAWRVLISQAATTQPSR